MGTRFYVERTVDPAGDAWPEIVGDALQDFDDALARALVLVVFKSSRLADFQLIDDDEWPDAVSILVGDEDGPDETAARIEHVHVAEQAEATKLGARAVLTIDAPEWVPRIVSAHVGGLWRFQIATADDQISVPIYVQMSERAPVSDDTAERFRMIERDEGVRYAAADDEDDTAKRFKEMELNVPMSKQRRAKYAELRRLSDEFMKLEAMKSLGSHRPRWNYLRKRIDEIRHELELDSVKQNPPPDPEHVEKAVDKFKEFHRYEAQKLAEISGLEIPRRVKKLGACKYVLYRSGKVDPATLQKPKRPVDYIHEHDAGVTAYTTRGEGDTDVPKAFTEATALVYLGKCLGFAVKDGPEAEATLPLPDLCCTPDGKCLLVVQDKKKVLAMMWGGALGVFARGIDG